MLKTLLIFIILSSIIYADRCSIRIDGTMNGDINQNGGDVNYHQTNQFYLEYIHHSINITNTIITDPKFYTKVKNEFSNLSNKITNIQDLTYSNKKLMKILFLKLEKEKKLTENLKQYFIKNLNQIKIEYEYLENVTSYNSWQIYKMDKEITKNREFIFVNTEDISTNKAEIETLKHKNNSIEIGTKINKFNPAIYDKIIKYNPQLSILGYLKGEINLKSLSISFLYFQNINKSRERGGFFLDNYEGIREREPIIIGGEISLKKFKFLDDIFSSNFFVNLELDYQRYSFLGDGSIANNITYYIAKEVFNPIEKGNIFFYTLLTKYKILYTKEIKNINIGIGIFDMQWKKPIYLQGKEINALYDGNYHTLGTSFSLKKIYNNYSFKAFLDYGLSNDLSFIKNEEIEDDFTLFSLGVEANTKIKLSSNFSITLGLDTNYINLKQEFGSVKELIYGVNIGVLLKL